MNTPLSQKQKKVFGILARIAEDLTPVANARIAAAIVHKGNIISLGYNQYKTHPLQKRFSSNPESVYLHAEIHAISNALKHYDISELSKMSLYVSRIKKEKRESHFICGLAKPCEGCSAAIKSFGINNVFYTTDETEVYNEL